MNFRTRLRFHRLPMPNAAEDLKGGERGGGGGGPTPPWYASDPTWAEAEKDAEFKGWVEKAKPPGAVQVLKNYRELEGKLGGALQPWKEGEDPTKWPGWNKLGGYEKAEDYTKVIKRPQMPEGVAYDEMAEKAALDLAAKIKAPAHIVQSFLDLTAQQRLAGLEATKNFEKTERDALDKVYGEWGVPRGADGKWQTENHPQIVNAQRAMKAMGMDQELTEALEGFAGGHRIMKLLSAIGAHPSIREGKLVTGEQHGSTSKDAALARIKVLDDKYVKEGLTKEEKAERAQMFAAAYPNGQAA